jgi:tetratricopeptide (TPR) repeat protein
MLDALKLEQLHKLETGIELQLKENNYDQALPLLLQSLGILNAEDVYDHTVQAFIAANTRTLKRCYFEIALKDFELKEYENARDRIEQALQLVIPPAYLGDTDLKYQFKLTVELTEILLLLDIDEKKELNKIETYRKIIRWQLKLLMLILPITIF